MSTARTHSEIHIQNEKFQPSYYRNKVVSEVSDRSKRAKQAQQSKPAKWSVAGQVTKCCVLNAIVCVYK